MTLPIILLLAAEIQHTVLPKDVAFPNIISSTENFLWLYDASTTTFWRIAGDNQAKFYPASGSAPWEFQNVSSLFVDATELIVTDWSSRKLVVFNHDFDYQRHHHFPFLIRDAIKVDDHYYVFGKDYQSGNIVHKLDLSFQPTQSFGHGFEDRRLVGQEAGFLATQGPRIVFAHVFKPHISWYDPDNKEIETARLKGYDADKPWISHARFTGQETGPRVQIHGLGADERVVQVLVRDYDVKTLWLYELTLSLIHI